MSSSWEIFFTFFLIFLIALASVLFAVPYNSPTIDGTISISGDDWDSDEIVCDDPVGDSFWGTANDFNNVYLTWDANFLYIGLEFTVADNAMILYLEMNLFGGVSDFNSTRGYGGAYPRNIVFPDTIAIDLIIGSWNGNGPYVYLVADSTSTEITSMCDVATGGNYEQELAVPWDEIYGEFSGIVISGAVINLVGVIAGGDDYGAADAAPDNSSIDGGAGPHELTQYITINVDADSNQIPDYAGEAVAGTVFFDDPQVVGPPYPEAKVTVHYHSTGDLFGSTTSSSDNGSYLLAGLEEGVSYDFIASANGFVPDTMKDYIVLSGGNEIDFTLEPHRGTVFGNITPSDFVSVIYAMCDSDIVGFGDTTEVGDGSYEITHLPDGVYNIIVEPSSGEYMVQRVEGVSVLQDSAVELNIVLERAGVVYEIEDAIGDDYGPGWYSYPTDPVFIEGAFDIHYVKVRDLASEGSYQFEIGIGKIPGASVVDWNPYYPPLNLQKIDIYIDCHSGGSTVGLPNRNVTFAATDAWDFAISVDGWWKGLLASNGQDIFSNFTQDLSSVSVEADTSAGKVFITFPKSALVDNLGQADTTDISCWDYIVLMLGHDNSGVDGVRWVNSGTSNQWQFNGGVDGDADPNVIDLVAMPGLDQYGNPKEPGRSQEEMLDYRVESPVVLEAAKSYDITPPTVDYTIPDAIEHLSGTPGVFIEVDINDDVGVSEAYLHWRNVGETDWRTPIFLGFRELTNSFVGDIPFGEVKPDSFEFFFEARDSAGNYCYDPQEYADSAEPEIPLYPYSPVSANPSRIVPVITDVDTYVQTIAINTFLDEKKIKFPDGAILIVHRDDILPAVDTIFLIYTSVDYDDIHSSNSPGLVSESQYRAIGIFSASGVVDLFSAPLFFSFHYYEAPDSQFDDVYENTFTMGILNEYTDIWVSVGGRNDVHSNTIDFNFENSGKVLLGLFGATNMCPTVDAISDIIVSPNPFSPNGDGIYDETNITLELNYDGTVDADIFSLDGSIVKQIFRNEQMYKGKNENFIWDGKDNNGVVQPVGIYIISVRLKYIFEGNERTERKNSALVIVR